MNTAVNVLPQKQSWFNDRQYKLTLMATSNNKWVADEKRSLQMNPESAAVLFVWSLAAFALHVRVHNVRTVQVLPTFLAPIQLRNHVDIAPYASQKLPALVEILLRVQCTVAAQSVRIC